MNRYLILFFFPAIMALSGCAVSYSVQFQEGNVKRLTSRPDAPVARKAAPEWTRDSLKTINYLESRIKILEAEKDDR